MEVGLILLHYHENQLSNSSICECGHSISEHSWMIINTRTLCYNVWAGGICDCRMYKPKEDIKMSINNVTLENLNDWLDYHAPSEVQIGQLSNLRAGAKLFARHILENCPESADRSFALRQLKITLMTANQSVILREL